MKIKEFFLYLWDIYEYVLARIDKSIYLRKQEENDYREYVKKRHFESVKGYSSKNEETS